MPSERQVSRHPESPEGRRRGAKHAEPELVQVWDVNNLAHMEDVIAKTLVMPYMRGTPTPRRQDPLPGRDNLLFTVPRNDLAVNMDQCLTLTQSAKDMAFTKESIGVKESVTQGDGGH